MSRFFSKYLCKLAWTGDSYHTSHTNVKRDHRKPHHLWRYGGCKKPTYKLKYTHINPENNTLIFGTVVLEKKENIC